MGALSEACCWVINCRACKLPGLFQHLNTPRAPTNPVCQNKITLEDIWNCNETALVTYFRYSIWTVARSKVESDFSPDPHYIVHGISLTPSCTCWRLDRFRLSQCSRLARTQGGYGAEGAEGGMDNKGRLIQLDLLESYILWR